VAFAAATGTEPTARYGYADVQSREPT